MVAAISSFVRQTQGFGYCDGRPETAPPGAAGPPYPFTAPVMALT
jgi:hypothetical protein